MQVLIARIGKPHGIRGEVTLELLTDSPHTRFALGQKVEIDRIDQLNQGLAERLEGAALTVSSARWNKKIFVVGFEEIKNRNDAELLRNFRLTAEGADQKEEDRYYEEDLVGLAVYLKEEEQQDLAAQKSIGHIESLITMPAQDLLVVKLSQGGQAMVPFVEQLVPVIDLEQGLIVLDPPPGLLDLGSASS
ncbi:MAG: ribosome maturation factor RimM [Rothia sp. (in: high G+C Gram-positive bacteria)]|nr:ribosome maturation factor RimM [Rothia sp. (in: high G+C Gram-positive bacteria)]